MRRIFVFALVLLMTGCSFTPQQTVNNEQCVGVMSSQDAYSGQDPNHFTVQVLALKQEKDVQDYIKHIDAKHPVWVNWKNSLGTRWYTVTVGDFTTKQKALDVISSLPHQVKQSAPFVMSFAEMQSKQETSVVRMR